MIKSAGSLIRARLQLSHFVFPNKYLISATGRNKQKLRLKESICSNESILLANNITIQWKQKNCELHLKKSQNYSENQIHI